MADILAALVAIEDKDYAAAIAELEPLAARGETQPLYLLGKLLLEGRGGADQTDRGVELLTNAAERDYGPAQALLGFLYANGIGVAPDAALAEQWLTRSLDRLGRGDIRRQAEATLASLRTKGPIAEVPAAAPVPEVSGAPVEPLPELAGEGAQKDDVITGEGSIIGPTEIEAGEPADLADEAGEGLGEGSAQAEPVMDQAALAPADDVSGPGAPEVAAIEPAVTQEPAAPENVAQTPPMAEAPAEAPTQAPAAVPAAEDNAIQTANVPDIMPRLAPADAPVIETAPLQAIAPTSQNESAQSTETTAQSIASDGIRIQLAAVPDKSMAEDEWRRIRERNSTLLAGREPIFRTIDLGQQGIFHRVQTGPFGTLAEARTLCAKLIEAGQDCIVMSR